MAFFAFAIRQFTNGQQVFAGKEPAAVFERQTLARFQLVRDIDKASVG